MAMLDGMLITENAKFVLMAKPNRKLKFNASVRGVTDESSRNSKR